MDTNDPFQVAQVATYVEQEFGLIVSRQTVYRWCKVGRRGQKLAARMRLGLLCTTKEEVNEFVASLDYSV